MTTERWFWPTEIIPFSPEDKAVLLISVNFVANQNLNVWTEYLVGLLFSMLKCCDGFKHFATAFNINLKHLIPGQNLGK